MDEFQKRMQDMLRKSNVSFVFGGQPAQEPKPGSSQGQKDIPPKNAEAIRKISEFNLKPRDIRDYLDRFVVKQGEAKKALSVAICDHYNHVRRCIETPSEQERDFAKHNIILLGPTGVGKTYLLRCIAKLIGVPFTKADATKFSETGYVGRDVEDVVRDLVKAANGDTELAKYGIIYIDEIDKIASAATSVGRDVSGRGVQINLLKLMEDTDVNLLSQTDLVGQIQAVMEMQRGKQPRQSINTRHMLFIVSGAFDKLSDLVQRRLDSAKIGFSQSGPDKHNETDYLSLAQTRDFIEFGFEPEFIGRLPVRIVCEHLTASDLEDILLKSEGSVLLQYKADFAGYGIDLATSRDAVSAVAALAEKERTGARGLMTVLEKTLRDFKFELPSTPITSLDLTAETVGEPGRTLRALLAAHTDLAGTMLRKEAAEFARKFEAESKFKLIFTGKAIGTLITICQTTGRPMRAVCEERFRDWQHGLGLVSKNTGLTSFTVTKAMITSPGKELSRMIAASFKKTDHSV